MYINIYIYIYTYTYVVREGGCDYLRTYLFIHMYAILLSRAWDHPKIKYVRKRAEGLKLKSKSYFIRTRIPQQHASNLRNLQGLNPEVLKSYNGNCP